MCKLTVGIVASLCVAGVAAASPFGGTPWLDGSNATHLSNAGLQAYSMETGALVYDSASSFGLANPPVTVDTYNSGIDNVNDPPSHGPFTASFTGSALRDDYTWGASATNVLTQFQFVGGVATAGDQIVVFFLDNNEDVVDSFAVSLPQAGNFIWTINLLDAQLKPLGFVANSSGFVQIQHGAQGNVTWFATDTVHIGSNVWDGTDDGSEAGTIFAFAMSNVLPAPSVLALLGLAGLVGARRRRA